MGATPCRGPRRLRPGSQTNVDALLMRDLAAAVTTWRAASTEVATLLDAAKGGETAVQAAAILAAAERRQSAILKVAAYAEVICETARLLPRADVCTPQDRD